MPSFPHRQLGLGQILDLHAAVGAPIIVSDHGSVYKHFDYWEGGINGSEKRRRVTYDDAETLRTKYAAVLQMGVGGVGMWTADATHRSNAVATVALAKQMWAAVRNTTAH
eukprot:COSAG02_NODE_37903_length_436_cov_0.614243_1_plen_109_part_01